MFLLLILLLIDIQNCSQFAVSQSAVKFLPGFQGPLPFELETGYVGVDEFEDVQLFYYFVKSDGNPKQDPLVLWLTGGIGCSSLTGLMYEIGPLYFESAQYDGVLPTLVLNHNSWTKVASIIFLDLPVGTGFSYGRTSHSSQSSDIQLCAQAFQFLRKWLNTHPEFNSNPFYMGGDSYSGIPVPIISQLISDGNQESPEQSINFKGYILGNPVTFPCEKYFAVPFSHGMGIISDELFESIRRSCGHDYLNLDLNSAECSGYLDAFEKCRARINRAHILETKCPLDSPMVDIPLSDERRDLNEIFTELINLDPQHSGYSCRVDGYWLSHDWLNNESVRKALHIREGTKGTWVRCEHNLPYKTTIWDSRTYHLNLSRIGYRSLIYSGDHDMVVPFQSTQYWIRNLNFSITDEWRPWILEDQCAGYTRTYSNHMTFATVKGGGHTAPEYKPRECYAMFKRWISEEPL